MSETPAELPEGWLPLMPKVCLLCGSHAITIGAVYLPPEGGVTTYALCAGCFALPDAAERAEAMLLADGG